MVVCNEELVEKVRRGEDVNENMSLLYLNNLPIIETLAKRYSHDEHTQEDLAQEAYFGLKKAVEVFDSSLGYKFMSLGKEYIRGYMLRSLREDNIIHVPSYAWDTYKLIEEVYQSFLNTTGKAPKLSEVQRIANISKSEYRTFLETKRALDVGSLNNRIRTPEDEIEIIEVIPSSDEVEDQAIMKIYNEEKAAVIWEEVDQLPKAMAEVVRKIYREGQSVGETAQSLGISYHQVVEKRKRAFIKLRRRPELRRLWDDGIYSWALHGTGLHAFKEKGSSVENVVIRMERFGLTSLK